VAVRSASGAASERATNEVGHAVSRWMITLARLYQSPRALDDPSTARRSEPNGNCAVLVKATPTIAAINQWL